MITIKCKFCNVHHSLWSAKVVSILIMLKISWKVSWKVKTTAEECKNPNL